MTTLKNALLELVSQVTNKDNPKTTEELTELMREFGFPTTKNTIQTTLYQALVNESAGWQHVVKVNTPEPGRTRLVRYYWDPSQTRVTGSRKTEIEKVKTVPIRDKDGNDSPSIARMFDLPELGFTLFVDTAGGVYKARKLIDE